MGAYLGNSKKLKLMINNVAFKIYSGKIINCVHEYSSTVISPTCTTQGYTKHSCSLCGNTYNSNYVPQLEHTIVIIPGKEATATTPGLTDGQKCSVCGKILKEQVEIPITHVHSSAYRTENRIEATCTDNGSYDHVEYCTSCYEVLNRTNNSIPATGHSWGEWITDKEATEYDNGSKHRVCDTCSEEETATIPALGHTHSYTSTVIAPTCEEGGYTLYTCSCNDSYTANPTPATGHTWGSWIVDKAATETAEGSQHRECANCDEVETETIPKTTHVHVAGEAKEENRVAATCDANGKYDLVVRCTGCGNIISSETKTIPAAGHTDGLAVVENRVEATCATKGSYDTVVYCTTCGTERSRVAHEIPVIAHTPGAAATCTEPQKCTVCHEVLIAATGHTEVIDNAVEATCTATGLTVGKHCSVCKATLIEQQIVPKKNHTASEPVEEDREEPTCTTDGSYNEVTYCSVCNAKMGSVLVTIPSPGHDDSKNPDNRCDICGVILCTDNDHIPVTIPGKAATCTSTGLTDGEKCSTCGKIITAQQTIDTLEHDYVVIKNGLAASCVSDGYTDTLKCSMCNDTIASQPIGAFGHDWESGEYPCTCERCGLHKPQYDSEESAGKCIHCGLECKHDFSNLIMDEVLPTCTEVGYTAVSECGHCGIRDGGEEIPELGHEFDESAPEEDICLCTRCHEYIHNTEGEKCECTDCGAHVYIDIDNDYRCDICGESICEEHDWLTSEEAKDPTCTEPGYTLSEYCGNCGETRGGEEIPELGHELVEGDETNCQCQRCWEYIHSITGCRCDNCGEYFHTDGNSDYLCDACGASLCTEHDWVTSVEATEPTCTEDGNTEGKYCGICGETIQSEIIKALSHDYFEGKCQNCGELCPHNDMSGCLCNDCGEYNHDHVNYEDVEPTCTTPGHTGGYYCTRCGDGKDYTTIPATGHSPVSRGDGVEPTCTTSGYTDSTYCSICYSALSNRTQIPATGHTGGETVRENYVAPGCETWGSYEEVVYCEDCGTEINRAKGGVIEPTGHDYSPCKCSRCGDEQHSAMSGCVCLACGYDGHDYDPCICSKCGLTNHGMEIEYEDIDPTCTTDGRKGGSYCEECEEDIVAPTIIPATGHNYIGNNDAIKETCGTAGRTESQTCSKCGDKVYGTVIPATGNHSYFEGTCEVCDHVCTHDNYDPEHDEVCPDCDEYVSGGGGDDPDACLIANTPILMADGTEKAIADVQAGDMIKSWDIENNEYIDVEVLGSYRTGDATDWLVYSFDNGKELTIYDQHNIYCKENNSIKKSTYWKPDQTAITLDGNETAYCSVIDSETPEAVSRHTLITENNLYFANGILCGHHPRAKYKFFTKGLLGASLEQASQYKETFDIYQAMNGSENEEYRKEAAELIENIRAAKRNVKDRNGKFAKDAGKLHKKQKNKKLKEIAQFNSESNTFKVDIKTINKNIRKTRKELNKIKEKYGVSTKTVYECWLEAYKLDMEYLRNKK